MEQRYKIIFDEAAAVDAALAIESLNIEPKVVNRRRSYVSVEVPPVSLAARRTAVEDSLEIIKREFGARVVEDFQYALEDDQPEFLVEVPDSQTEASLEDVVLDVAAPQAWVRSRGSGVLIAVVDTGISTARPEFPQWKRSGSWEAVGETPWTDWQGHGTMCATIAAGTRSDGGLFDGVAPDASVMACRTRFFDSELTQIYDVLTERAQAGETVVSTNSFGLKVGGPPAVPVDNDFPDALGDAIAAGVHVFFSAGNNHELAGGRPDQCQPNSVWLHKSRADLMAVATCRLDGTMWYYSSRGPGQHHGDPNTNRKPDVTAPTPRNGRVVYGDGVRVLENGWGTSGACPQAAGLAALLLSLDRTLKSEDVREIIRETADDIGHAWECGGAGKINCERALSRLLTS